MSVCVRVFLREGEGQRDGDREREEQQTRDSQPGKRDGLAPESEAQGRLVDAVPGSR